MIYNLRPYQQDAVSNTLAHFRRSDDSAVIVLPTGAGKSLVIAELARLAKHKLLVLAHVKELVEQNWQKYASFGLEASIYSAGLGQKSLANQVTFASIQSIAKNLSALDSYYSLVIIDECHRLSDDDNSQYLQVINQLKSINPQLKILGLTATPYRLGIGWIYYQHYRGFVRGDINSPFKKCIFELPLSYMIKHGYLTVPRELKPAVEHYDFSALMADPYGRISEKDLNTLLHKQQRVTKTIVEDIRALSAMRSGVMIFASTIKHAEEITSYLQTESVALVTGKTAKQERDEIIRQFKAKQIKYLVNVSVLTTGFDAPHVDVIAILRPTESISLYQQIVGRGLRLAPHKTDCLVIDYADNGFDLFRPEVGSKRPAPDTEPVQVVCPGCGFANTFWGRTDSQGKVIEHFGRRCQGLLVDEDEQQQCDYRFRFKTCGQCGAENDIAARVCQSCDMVLVDPDDKLRDALNLKHALVIRCAGLSITAKGQVLTITYHDEEGVELKERIDFANSQRKAQFMAEYLKRFQDLHPEAELNSVAAVLAAAGQLRAPDFVIAKKHAKFGWQITDKLFDYQGRYRKANQLG
ncbi:DEAD/DEAH box helicase [Pseudoalteromonas fenneropenaei]|uniref:DEAD/DEAH box helicase n=1 Tax=Pseudoalteromonas fenneropenaei TaxID=1737459 RepID=A0ABV7CI40_9GAMM